MLQSGRCLALALLLPLALLVGPAATAAAADGGSDESVIGTKASGMVWRDKLQSLIQAKGIDRAIALLREPQSRFGQAKHHMAILSVTEADRVILEAHTVLQKLTGMDLTDLRDMEGRAFIQEFLKAVRAGGGAVPTANAIPETDGEILKSECYNEWAQGYKGDYFITVCYDRPPG